jgi:glucose/arabinose dehydrogenase
MRRRLYPTLAVLLLAACGAPRDADAQAPAAAAAAPAAAAPAAPLPFRMEEVADLESPWALTFLPDGRMLITEKAGKLLLGSADGKQHTALAGVPAVMSEGQGGLMDVVLHPRFVQNRLVYFSYSEAGEGGNKGLVLARGEFVDGAAPSLRNVQTLFRATPYVDGNGHFAGRIAFAPDGKLFFTNGDRQKFEPAQDPKATLGKVLRLNDDGTPAAGNPLAAQGFHPAVWSYGHRNQLGIAFDASGKLWEQEMGPKGGDEVNLVLPSRNYGYPRVSNGSHYDGAPLNGADIPDHAPGDGFEAPKVWWNPAISPGGLMVYSGKRWPQWRGDLFIGGLSSEALIRVDVNGDRASKGDQWPMGMRVREAKEGPDGSIWVLEDGRREGKGRLVRLTPAG